MDNRDQYECAMCGRDGLPPESCETCHGRAKIQSKAYTLSDYTAGRAPKEDRYGHEGGLAPKRMNLPGSSY